VLLLERHQVDFIHDSLIKIYKLEMHREHHHILEDQL